MTKICHVISGYFRNDARVFQRQCKSLHKAGFEICLLTNDGESEEILDGIKIFTCKTFWKNRFKVLLFARHQFYQKSIEIDADIYQMHSPELITLGLALKKLGKTVMYDAHEDLPRHILEKEWIPAFMRKTISRLVEGFMNKSLAKYDEIISPHTHVVKYLKGINKNVTLITNYPIISNSREFSVENYLGRDKIICYTGTVYEYSNQEAILDAMLYIPDIKYEIAGYIGEQHLQRLSVHKVFDRVKFRGRIPWSQMRNFYDRTIIGLVIYDYKYNLGYKLGSHATNKIFEYMEAGIPFISTDYILWKEITDKHDCGICVEPGNITQIKDAITFLLNNPKKAFEMGQNGRRAAVNEYNWSSQEKLYVELVRKHERID